MSNKFTSKSKLELHYTATGFVLNKSGDRILFILHKKLQIWLPPGGHVDEGELPHEAVVREVFEETGVRAEIVDPIGDLGLVVNGQEIQISTPIAVFHENIPAHGVKPEHLHYDFLYHMKSLEEHLVHAEKEIEAAHWFTLDEVLNCKTTKGSQAICKILMSKNFK
ncbi:MAG: NUDIX domain-containing protein [Candidatus Babeliales bacterium]